ncbi:MAG TPA: signal recognition particle-docking protein FtsY [Methyloceanibacter sp.]|nr:signal recognition particle-docking protein FtsY [Methyloceanibacter sp.]
MMESKRGSFFDRLRQATAADGDEPDEEAGPTAPKPKHSEPKEHPEPKTPKPERPAPPPNAPEPTEPDPEPDREPEEEAGPMSPEPNKGKARAAETKRSWFAQLKSGLSRTSNSLTENLAGVLTKRKLDEDTLDELEDVLIKADLGVAMADRIREAISSGRFDKGFTEEDVRAVLATEVARVLGPVAQPFALDESAKPHVMLVVGVNGTGKTTTIGKLAHQFARDGKKVMLAAGDTFRAAAIDQLKVWGGRVGAEVVAKNVGADPAGVSYEALERAKAEGADVLLIDTAGRLQNKGDLMAELAKIVRVLKKLDPAAPHSVVLVLDATTGQNAINQVQSFQEIAGVTNLVVTKLDGTARGGILVAIAERFGLPINAIGIGEGIEDFEPFDAQDFARAIAGASRENDAAA